MRDWLAHHYLDTAPARIEITIIEDLPPLEAAVLGSKPAAGSPKTASVTAPVMVTRTTSGWTDSSRPSGAATVLARCTARRQPRATGSCAVPESRTSGPPGFWRQPSRFARAEMVEVSGQHANRLILVESRLSRYCCD